ncbi:hypothetical protein O181_081781 [Austropuccinia psidii MF-1]|uniref:Retrovirus-related Pol polyprotein from transposon TNT 1-94-like beta-barrel domain-containing protein n=1 Tax=Austropuccinia psidii MF-1 TaxID=1389203 RepID=A0A9Q3IGA3_9BASI|nr:hypothetical protein [Austropuccinia psidii MF-1]
MTDKITDAKDLTDIPILDGTNFSQWNIQMKIHLCAKDLLDVCEKSLPGDATILATNKWLKASYDAINIITTRISKRVFLEVINSENTEKANFLWAKINKQYASKRAINRGRIWMEFQRYFYNGDLQVYIDSCRKLLMKLETVSIKIPKELLFYSLIGKLAGDSKLHQLVETLTLNEELIKSPDLILTRLQDYVHLIGSQDPPPTNLPSAPISTIDNSFKIIHYCTNGKHNAKSTTHKKEQCWAENSQLRPNQRDHKQRKFQPATHFLTATALVTSLEDEKTTTHQVILDCGATHHMFNSKSFFTSLNSLPPFTVTTGNSSSSLLALGTGSVELFCKSQPLVLMDCLCIPKLSCNLISLLALFEMNITVHQVEDKFTLESNGKTILKGKIINKLMHIDYMLPTTLITTKDQALWHRRLGHPGTLVLKRMGLPYEITTCSVCKINKSHKQPFNHQFNSAAQPLDCIHLDLIGPVVRASISGCQYILTIVDQTASFKLFKFLKKKSEAFHQFCIVKTFMENQQDQKVKRVFSSNLRNPYWAEAVNTATLLSNLVPTPSRLNQSPYSLWTNQPP